MIGDPQNVKVRLSRLRDIGWQLWDPIGIAGHRENCDDEYDGYLLHVAGLLIDGRSRAEGVAYLVDAASNWMGGFPYRAEAERTVDALADYVAALQAGMI